MPGQGWAGSVHILSNPMAIGQANHVPGLGSMGLAMAINLQRHLAAVEGAEPVHYFNRTISRGEPLHQIGGQPAQSVQGLVARCDVVFMSLSDDDALTSTVQAMVGSPSAGSSLAGKIIVDTTTVHPDTTASVAAQLSGQGARFIAAPVFGASPVAAKGQLLWILAGPEDAVRVIDPFIVGVMGRGIIRLGEAPRQATLLKTAGLVWSIMNGDPPGARDG